MSKRVEITQAEFEAAKAEMTSFHKYVEGEYTVSQHYTMRSGVAPVESWYNRATGERTYKRIEG